MIKKISGILFCLIVLSLVLVPVISADDGVNPEPDQTPVERPREIPEHIRSPWKFAEGIITPEESTITPFLITPKIIGGTSYSPENKYPWLVSLHVYGEHYCGGTLIAPQWVLTAAHCWTNASGVPYTPGSEDLAILGEYDFSVNSGNEQAIGIDEVFIHPSYAPTTFRYDFALLKLATPASINAYVRPITLAGSGIGNLDNTPAAIVGWGSTTYPEETYPDIAQEGLIEVLPDSGCSNYFSAYQPESMLCAGLPEGGVDTCLGDSGGPLSIQQESTPTLVGITSWGNGCALEGYPGVYARVTAALTWIESTISAETVCHTLTLGVTGEGSSIAAVPVNSVACAAGTYHQGESIMVYGASPDIGWHIAGWTGTVDNVSTASENTVTMPGSTHSVTVAYAENPVVSTWHLAEGYTGGGFGTYILIQNPNDSPTQIDVSYQLEGGTIINKEVIVPANSRYTIVTQDPAQVGPNQAFSTTLQADQPVLVERAMYWPNGDGTLGGHATTGVRQANTNWYLAEGFTGGGFQTFILIQNPGGAAASVEITYMIEGGGVVSKNVSVPANSRYTILANDAAQVGPDQAFSTSLSSSSPIIVERAMYFQNEGHVSNAISAPATTWYLAEGFTGSGYQTFILVQNPNASSANVTVNYMLSTGGVVSKNLVVAGNSRYTIAVHQPEQLGLDQVFSSQIVSDQAIIVERAIYWQNGSGSIAGHNTTGILGPASTWYLAEGYTGAGFETFILLQNPNSSAANVDVIYMLQGGGTIMTNVVVPGNSRSTILANDGAQVGLDQAFSTKLVSDQPIIVERAMYFSNGGHVVEAITLVE